MLKLALKLPKYESVATFIGKLPYDDIFTFPFWLFARMPLRR